MSPPPQPPPEPIRALSGQAAPPEKWAWPRLFYEVLPVRLRGDVLYLWSTFRLRERPIKMLALILLMGAACWLWEWAGRRYLVIPMISPAINKLQNDFWRSLLGITANAIFSSLNLLSMLSIVVVSRSLRRLLKEGHIEALQLTPNRFRPSALYYALAMRYVAIAPMGLLILYLDPDSTPFKAIPFVDPTQHTQATYDPILASPWSVHWAAISQFSLLLYCVTNVAMDLAVAFWFLARWRPTIANSAIAVVVVGFVSPIGVLWHAKFIQKWLAQGAWPRKIRYELFTSHPDYRWIHSVMPDPSDALYSFLTSSTHYILASIYSLIVAAIILWSLDWRWHRRRNSKTKDPIFIQSID